MAQMNIITIPDKLLRAKSAPVERVDDELRGLIDDMLETMYDASGIGLARTSQQRTTFLSLTRSTMQTLRTLERFLPSFIATPKRLRSLVKRTRWRANSLACRGTSSVC